MLNLPHPRAEALPTLKLQPCTYSVSQEYDNANPKSHEGRGSMITSGKYFSKKTVKCPLLVYGDPVGRPAGGFVADGQFWKCCILL